MPQNLHKYSQRIPSYNSRTSQICQPWNCLRHIGQGHSFPLYACNVHCSGQSRDNNHDDPKVRCAESRIRHSLHLDAEAVPMTTFEADIPR